MIDLNEPIAMKSPALWIHWDLYREAMIETRRLVALKFHHDRAMNGPVKSEKASIDEPADVK